MKDEEKKKRAKKSVDPGAEEPRAKTEMVKDSSITARKEKAKTKK